MLGDRSKQKNNADEPQTRSERAKQTRRGQVPPIVRSPALESAEQGRKGRLAKRQSDAEAAQREALRPQRKGSATPARRTRSNRVSYAAEETLVRPTMPRKSLPRRGGSFFKSAAPPSAGSRQRTGLTAGWRARTPWLDEETASEPVQAISAEEQKKLAALEMSLPRVAGKIDPWLMIIVIALICVGLVMVYSASSFVSAQQYGDASYFFQKQMLWVIIGIPAMLTTMRIDYRLWRRFSLVGMIIILPLLVIVLKFGTPIYGAVRWINLGSFFSFQPSEVTKLVLTLYIADWLARKGKQVGTFLYGMAPFVLLIGLILGLVLLEKDMGTAIIIAGFATAMFFTAGANITQFLLAMGCGGAVFFVQAIFEPYRYARVVGFLNPFKHVTDINLQLYQSLLALGSGGWFGVGLGASRQKTGYLPFPYNDSIFAITGEELGFIGCALIVLLFLFLAFRGFRLARRTQDIYGALLATGITTWLVLQAMINVGASTGSIPYTGVPLPFISFGGSSLVISMAAIGVLLNISRYIQEPEVPALSKHNVTLSIKKKTQAQTR